MKDLTEDYLNYLVADDCAKALEQWCEDIGEDPGPFGSKGQKTSSGSGGGLREQFAEWCQSHEAKLLEIVCPKWHELAEKKKEAGLHAMVLALAALLETASLGLAHYSATAILIGCKWGVDHRCANHKRPNNVS